ncbi:MAG: DUF1016 N-terminal domain-containing protein [bacterium]
MGNSKELVKIETVENIESRESYKNLLGELKSILKSGQLRAYKAVDNIKVQTYWQIGERIVREEFSNRDRAEYGKFLIKQLSKDLLIERQRLYEIVKFYRCFEIVRTVSGQLSWNHYLELIRIENKHLRELYQAETIKGNWSVRELRLQLSV